ncbi:MAG: hypothetical protein H0W67_00235 [Gemmatimonadales bacterium]|nr:hypothetical protein [Gemmatimonadales bacterium]
MAFFLVAGCSSPDTTQPTDVATEPVAGLVPGNLAASHGDVTTSKLPQFDPADFVRRIDNPFLPLRPGTRFVYAGTEDGESLRDLFDVTHEVKTILGVRATVVLDRLYKEGELVEKTFDYFAQDRRGNVWYLGEDTKEFENGRVSSTEGTWLAGRDGARAGIAMPAHPKIGQTVQQEFAKGVAEDMTTFVRRGVRVSTRFGSFHGCLKTEDFTPLEPGAKEVKFYCRGIGFVKGHDVTGGSVRLSLVDIRR